MAIFGFTLSCIVVLCLFGMAWVNNSLTGPRLLCAIIGIAALIGSIYIVKNEHSGHALPQSSLDKGKIYVVDLMISDSDAYYVGVPSDKVEEKTRRHTFYVLDNPLPDEARCFYVAETLNGKSKAMPTECQK